MFEEAAVADQPTTETADQSAIESAAQDSSAEATGAEQTTGAQTEGEQESTYQLPDEQSKVWSDDALMGFAQARYSKLADALNDPSTPAPIREQVKQILHDKLNGDIYIQKLRAQEEGDDTDDDLDDGQDAPIVEADQVKLQEHWNQAVTQFVDRVTDAKVAQTFTDNFIKAFDIKDPQEKALAVTKTLSGAAVNLMRDAVPELLFTPGPDGRTLLDRYLESKYEGLSGMVKTNSYGQAWEDLRASDPKFSSTPKYNTPEWQTAIREVAAMVPGFENAVFTGKDGRILSPYQNFVEKSKVAIKLMSSRQGTPTQDKAIAIASKAVETGKKVEREATRSRNNANLGAGQSRGQLSSAASDPLKDAIAKHRADNGFAGMDTSKVILSGPGQQTR